MKFPVYATLFACVFLALSPAQGQSTNKVPISKAVITGIQLQDTPLPTVLDFLRVKASETGAQPGNFVLYDPSGTIAARNPNITLNLSNVPLSEVVRYVASLSKTEFLIDRNAIVLGEKRDLSILKNRRNSLATAAAGNGQMLQLAGIQEPSIDFNEVDLNTALDFFRAKANPPGGKGIPINFWLKENDSGTIGGRLITLNLENVSLLDAVRYTTELAGCTMRPDATALVVGETESLAQKPNIAGNPNDPLLQQLARSIIENVELAETSMGDVITFVKFHTRDEGRYPDGVNIIVQKPVEKTVSMKFAKARAIDILIYTCEATGNTFKSDGTAILVLPQPPPPTKP